MAYNVELVLALSAESTRLSDALKELLAAATKIWDEAPCCQLALHTDVMALEKAIKKANKVLKRKEKDGL